MFASVIVGVGAFEAGRDAVELAKALMSEDGEVALVYVESVVSEPAPEPRTGSEAERQRFGLERLGRLRDDAQIPAEVLRIEARSVQRGLYGFAAGRGADLIVIGASRGTRLEHRLVGDDARAVLEDPPCAVAVAPAGYSARSTAIRKIGVGYGGSPESERALAVARGIAAERGATVELAGDTVEGLRRCGASVDLLVLGSHGHPSPLERSNRQRLAERPSSPLLVLAAGR